MRFILAVAVLFLLPASANAIQFTQSSPATVEKIKRLIDSADRPIAQKARDRYRNPLETLAFCGIQPDMTVVEIWPGGQGAWYRRIIEPLLNDGGGQYLPVEGRSAFPERIRKIPYGEVDLVLVFRAHGFMIYDRPAQEYVNAIYTMLAPGGTFCIVDHAGDESISQDPKGENGYVNESHFFTLAKRAGFNIAAASDHNRNLMDTKDHPHGVWSLPPTSRGSLPLTPARKKYQDIGESDRFTHKYYRPE